MNAHHKAAGGDLRVFDLYGEDISIGRDRYKTCSLLTKASVEHADDMGPWLLRYRRQQSVHKKASRKSNYCRCDLPTVTCSDWSP